MIRSEVEVKTFKAVYHCRECGRLLTEGRHYLMGNPIQYVWDCLPCGMAWKTNEAPRFIYKVVQFAR